MSAKDCLLLAVWVASIDTDTFAGFNHVGERPRVVAFTPADAEPLERIRSDAEPRGQLVPLADRYSFYVLIRFSLPAPLRDQP